MAKRLLFITLGLILTFIAVSIVSLNNRIVSTEIAKFELIFSLNTDLRDNYQEVKNLINQSIEENKQSENSHHPLDSKIVNAILEHTRLVRESDNATPLNYFMASKLLSDITLNPDYKYSITTRNGKRLHSDQDEAIHQELIAFYCPFLENTYKTITENKLQDMFDSLNSMPLLFVNADLKAKARSYPDFIKGYIDNSEIILHNIQDGQDIKCN